MNRLILGFVFVIASIGLILLVVYFATSRGEVSASAKRQIRVGTPRAKVLELCGPPTGKRSTEFFYDYDDPEIAGWYAVYFDEKGFVKSIDDESF